MFRRRLGHGGVGFRNFHAHFLRAFEEMFPRKGARPFGGELVKERHGIVAVDQDEVVADRQFEKGANDQAVFDGTGYVADIEDMIRAD